MRKLMLRGIALLSLVGCSSFAGTQPSDIPSIPLKDLQCSLLIRSISVQEQGLSLRCGNQAFRVYHPKNLHGMVVVRDEEDALQFVRFFTSRRTYFLVGMDGMVEIASDPSSRDFFTVPRELFESRFAPPKVEYYEDPLEGRVFTIVRYVVALDQNLYRITERVTQHGNYDRRQRTLVAADALTFGIVHLGDN